MDSVITFYSLIEQIFISVHCMLGTSLGVGKQHWEKQFQPSRLQLSKEDK